MKLRTPNPGRARLLPGRSSRSSYAPAGVQHGGCDAPSQDVDAAPRRADGDGESLATRRRVHSSATGRRSHGFSMIEIAIALAVIAFALVAIIGVLPIGLNVQRDNRAETIINQDAAYWMEAIRGGSQGLEDLTNYVDSIEMRYADNTTTNFENHFLNPNAAYKFRTGYEIIGLLSTPTTASLLVPSPSTNIAIVRAISGAATEKAATAAQWSGQELAFRYRLTTRITRVDPTVTQDFSTAVGSAASEPLDTTLYHIQLQFNWPVFGNNKTGTRQKTYNSMASRYLTTNITSSPWFYHLTP